MASESGDWGAAGNAIEARRGQLHLSQKEAAELARIDVTTWQEIEAGRGEGSRRATFAAMADALGWDPDQIQRIAAGEPPPWRVAAEREAALHATVSALSAEITVLRERLAALEAAPDE